MCIYNQHFTEINTDLDQFDSNSLEKNAPYYMYNTCACVWVITKFSINVIKIFLYFWYQSSFGRTDNRFQNPICAVSNYSFVCFKKTGYVRRDAI